MAFFLGAVLEAEGFEGVFLEVCFGGKDSGEILERIFRGFPGQFWGSVFLKGDFLQG